VISLDRRLLLSIIAGAITASEMARAAPLPPPARRSLRLINPHTGETFDGPYRDDSGVIPSAVADLSVFLRDFHSGEIIAMDMGVVDFLAAVMEATGQSEATILSAYRTRETNEMLARTNFGVAENSQHIFGRALDVHFGSNLAEAMAAARAMQHGGVGWYPHSAFMHIDTGPVRNWDLGAEGLQDALTKWPAPTPLPPKGSGTMLVEGPGRLTVGGGKPTAVAPGRTLRTAHGRVAGLLSPLAKGQ
jgi:uncharacterized protein YcbK (DUF882 family)